ncbi:MAG: hypothetical protein D6815_06805 [Candidatus Dadabacteria bacterium]|nr:MAG: hypothetical protein D6815_06805 [Candidatus Dadabacteria bacterium]
MAVRKKGAKKKATKKKAAKKAVKKKAAKKTAAKKKAAKKKAAKKKAAKKATKKAAKKKKETKRSVRKVTVKKASAKKAAATSTAKKKAPERIPIAAGLFAETPEGPRLLGSRCTTCGTPYFPKADLCRNPECSESRLEEATFGPYGTIWSCAVQNYPPPAPARFDEPYKPYALGVVDTDDGLRVVSRIATDDPNSVEPNMRAELVIEPLCHDESGNELLTWMFRPV